MTFRRVYHRCFRTYLLLSSVSCSCRCLLRIRARAKILVKGGVCTTPQMLSNAAFPGVEPTEEEQVEILRSLLLIQLTIHTLLNFLYVLFNLLWNPQQVEILRIFFLKRQLLHFFFLRSQLRSFLYFSRSTSAYFLYFSSCTSPEVLLLT